jgi:protein phosphatase
MLNLKKLLGFSQKSEGEEMAFGRTDIGKIREKNEDYFLVNQQKGLFIVSDGMGGHNAGEVASMNASKEVEKYLTIDRLAKMHQDEKMVEREIISSIRSAHTSIQELAKKKKEYQGMGCTIMVALVFDGTLHLGHVGDSRAYKSDNKELKLLTIDHSYVMQLVKEGKMRMDEIRTSPIKNHLSQALGAPIEVEPDYNRYSFAENERVLLCSDGLWDMITEQEIHKILTQRRSKAEICQDLIRRANRAGGHDNITVVVIDHPKKVSRGDGSRSDSDRAGKYNIVFDAPKEE